MVAKIFTNPVNYNLQIWYEKSEDEILIGVEDGAYYALQQGLNLDYAIGDFDSLEETKKNTVLNRVEKVIKYPSQKDYTDTYLAVKKALEYEAEEIIIYGGIGARFDHSYANLLLLKLGPISMLNDNHKIYLLDPGKYHIEATFNNISFFALEDIKDLNLDGFEYDLKGYDLKIDDPLCISNHGSGEVTFQKGLMLVIESKEE